MDEWFDELAERLLAQHADLERGRMLRSAGLKTGGKFFATVVDDDVASQTKRQTKRQTKPAACRAGTRPMCGVRSCSATCSCSRT